MEDSHFTLQKLQAMGKNELDNIKQQAFLHQCDIGDLETAKWLHSLGGINIHECNDYAFRWSCCYGHLEIAQELISLGGIPNKFILKCNID